MNQITENDIDVENELIIKEAITSISNFTNSYDLSTIEETVRKEACKQTSFTAKSLTQKAYSTLNKKQKDRKKTKKIAHEDMLNEVLNEDIQK